MKIGDKIKLVKIIPGDDEKDTIKELSGLIGSIGIITDIKHIDGYNIDVSFSKSKEFKFKKEELELVEVEKELLNKSNKFEF